MMDDGRQPITIVSDSGDLKINFIHSFICLRHTSHRIHTKVNNTVQRTHMAVVIVFVRQIKTLMFDGE